MPANLVWSSSKDALLIPHIITISVKITVGENHPKSIVYRLKSNDSSQNQKFKRFYEEKSKKIEEIVESVHKRHLTIKRPKISRGQMRVGKTWSIWLLLVHLCAFLQFLPLQWCFKVEQSFQKLWASLCIFMALKEDVMYVNWDGRTFLSCQNDGVYIPFSSFRLEQNTTRITNFWKRAHFNFSSLTNCSRGRFHLYT